MEKRIAKRRRIPPVASRLSLALALGAAASAQARAIDFGSQAGLEATCPPLLDAKPGALTRDDERVAFAICSGVSLATDAMTWWRVEGTRLQLQDPAARAAVRARLESYLSRITAARAALERVHARKPLLVVEPGNWAVDFDGDGTVSLGERYFFWAPKAGIDMSLMERAGSEADYRVRYLAPVVNVDQSDVHWALAYCNFAEAALHLVLSYDLASDGTDRLVLVDRARVRGPAYKRLREGIRESGRLRRSLLAETDDDREWIPNPRQKHTSFPLVMDEQTFATWGAVLTELDRMLEGKALLGGKVDAGALRGLGDLTSGLCPAGSGIDLRDLFMNPLAQPMNPKELASRCVPATASKPISAMASVITATIRRNSAAAPGAPSGEWKLLRHLYWVN